MVILNTYRQKRIRFPKGKKVKPGEEKVDVWKPSEDAQSAKNDPRRAAKERAMQRNQMTTELCSEENRGMVHDITSVEVKYAVCVSIFYRMLVAFVVLVSLFLLVKLLNVKKIVDEKKKMKSWKLVAK